MVSRLLPSTIAVICILALIIALPLCIYLHIIVTFLSNRDLQTQLKGGKERPKPKEVDKPTVNNNNNGDDLVNQTNEGGERVQSPSTSLSNLTSKSEEAPAQLLASSTQNSTEILEESTNKNDPPTSLHSTNSFRTAPVLLSCQNLSYVVKSTQQHILNGVTCWFAPGTLTAILGTSGCGKTTLLTILADQVESTGESQGKVYVNGKERLNHSSSSFRDRCAYVMQSETLQDSLTVRETLWFTAEFRLDASQFDPDTKWQIIKQVLRDLDLEKAADRRVSVLSGGQKRRLTVGIELVAQPSLVFLDEPTTGLDASGSLKLVRVLRNLANQGKTIVSTIHQPRLDAFNQFDMVLLMNAGKVVYFGPSDQILTYFANQNRVEKMVSSIPALADFRLTIQSLSERLFAEPEAENAGESSPNEEENEEPINPADFVLDLTHGSREEIMILCNDYENSDLYKATMQASQEMIDEPVGPNKAETAQTQRTIQVEMVKAKLEIVIPAVIAVSSSRRLLDRVHCCCAQPPSASSMATEGTTFYKQVFTLVRRQFVTDIRNRSYINTWVLGIIMMLFLGLLYLWVSKPPFAVYVLPTINQNLVQWGACTQNLTDIATIIGVPSASQANETLLQCGVDLWKSYQLSLARASFLYQVLVSMFFSEFPLVAQIYNDRLLYKKEVASRTYTPAAWMASWVTKISITGFIKGLVYPIFVYFLASLPMDFESYVLFAMFVGIMSIAGASSALLVCVAFTSFEAAQVAFIFIKTISQALSGYYISRSYIPWWFRWIYYINFFRYTFEGSVIAINLTGELYDITKRLGLQKQFMELAREAWNYALVSIFFCICFQLIALGFVLVEAKSCGGGQQHAGRCVKSVRSRCSRFYCLAIRPNSC